MWLLLRVISSLMLGILLLYLRGRRKNRRGKSRQRLTLWVD